MRTARISQPQQEGRRQVPGASAAYTAIVGGMVQRRRCACLLFDTHPAPQPARQLPRRAAGHVRVDRGRS